MAVVCQGYYLEINLASSNISPKAVCKNCFSMLIHSVYLSGVRAAIPHGRLNNILICTFYFTHFVSLQLLEQDEFPQDIGLWLKGVSKSIFKPAAHCTNVFFLSAWQASLCIWNNIFIGILSSAELYWKPNRRSMFTQMNEHITTTPYRKLRFIF